MARLNLLAGLAGFYLIQDPNDRVASLLPDDNYRVLLAVQDRSFYARDTDGHNELAFPNAGAVPGVHPYWSPEFFGDVITVNGHTWPYLDVDRGQYRLTILNGCNARFLNLFLDNGMTFVAIGSDGGYLQSPSRQASILVPPGSRAEMLLDFTFVAPGTEIVLRNDAKAPYPGGDPVNPATTGQIMQFRVGSATGFAPKKLPVLLNPTLCGQEWPVLQPGGFKRILTLTGRPDAQGNPPGLFLNGQTWAAAASETPKNGTTEDWYLINLSGDAQPVHLHLVQFQLVSRQDLDAAKYCAEWLDLNREGLTDGMLPFKTAWKTKVLPFEPYLAPGTRAGPQPGEKGWKDTVGAMPGQVTRIRLRFRRQNGTPFSFDPTAGPGYAWHSQIVDQEDNEMIRPLVIRK
jgi:FtsP/CotA-like multicopper oxidase with cupredoxin domain